MALQLSGAMFFFNNRFFRWIIFLMLFLPVISCKNKNRPLAQSPATPTVSYGGDYHQAEILKEDFEQGRKPSYANQIIGLKTGKWIFADALLGVSPEDKKNGKQAVRIRGNGKISMLFDVNGCIAITIKHGVYGHDKSSAWALFFSGDGGKTYRQIGPVTTSSTQFATATFAVEKSGKLRFEIRKISGGKNRINIDDFTLKGSSDTQTDAGTSVSTGDTIAAPQPPPVQDTTQNGDNSNLLLGNPSGATASISNYNNYLINQQYYVESYSRDRCGPNWVCWHIGAADLGSFKRLNNFRADTKLPRGWYEAQNYSYTNSGFDKGHNCPSGDRTNNADANSATFLMDNIVPQAPYNNQRTWEHLEGFCRDQIALGNEVYVMMGSYGTGGTGTKGSANTIDSGRINVPAHIWKVVLIIPSGDHDLSRIDANSTIIAINTPNDNSINPDWMQYVCSVRDIEKNTGYKLLSALPQDVQDVLETRIYGGTPKLRRNAR